MEHSFDTGRWLIYKQANRVSSESDKRNKAKLVDSDWEGARESLGDDL